MKYKCLSIAGFDGSGGAGIQADLKTFSALGCYGMTVLTALPVQNTMGVKRCYDIPLQAIEDQLIAIFDDIVPDSIKIGMLYSEPIIELVSNFLSRHARDIPIVVDPVMVAKSGDPLLLPSAIQALKTRLIPLATVITPNLPEAYALVGEISDAESLGQQLLALGGQSVLLKGGHSGGTMANDLFVDQHTQQWLTAERVETNNTHGTGCTLSAAICALLAQDFSLLHACEQAKYYLLNAIRAAKAYGVGKGQGPVHHFYHIWPALYNQRFVIKG
jgi:hydroxymethylpyrimidine/phosphomethylpyrimidine kinase